MSGSMACVIHVREQIAAAECSFLVESKAEVTPTHCDVCSYPRKQPLMSAASTSSFGCVYKSTA